MLRPAADLLRRLWRTSPLLTAAGLLMLPVLAAALAGLWLDPRTITGAPAWLKPAKFAASIAIYTLSLAWVFTHIPAWVRTRRIVGAVTSVAMVVEIAVISVQAWRGAASHFNVATPLDGVLFTIMGLAIVVQTMSSIAVAVALWRERFADAALGWALRLGLTLTIVGAATGGLMTRPSDAQLAEARTSGLVTAGAHTVGAPDGGPGMPGTGWSTEHGDLRVPHFLGLHALQALALILVALPRRWSPSRRARLMVTAAASYAALFVLLLVQALEGESLVAPGETTVIALGLWTIASAATAWIAARARSPHARPAMGELTV